MSTRKVVLELKVQFLWDMGCEMPDDELVQFQTEENTCVHNYLYQLFEEVKRGDNESVCNVCWRASTKLLRDATPEDIEKMV